MSDVFPEVKMNRLLNEASNDFVIRRVAAFCLENGLQWYEIDSLNSAAFMAYVRQNFQLASPDNTNKIVDMAKDDLQLERAREHHG